MKIKMSAETQKCCVRFSMQNLIFLLLFFATANLFGQAANSYEAPRRIAKGQKDFVVERLDAENLVAFEQMAIQKVKDFTNYMTIISDDSYDIAFKNHATKLALALFTDDFVPIRQSKITKSKGKTSITHFLGILKESKYDKIEVKANGVYVLMPLIRKNRNYYTGTLAYSESINLFQKGKSKTFNQTVHIEFSLRKETKRFGRRMESIWTVKLGNINALN